MISILAFILSIIAILAIINIAYYIHTMQVRNPYLTDEQEPVSYTHLTLPTNSRV